MDKNSKQNIALANSTIGDLFANANPLKPVKIKSKFIINDFLSPKNFKRNGKLTKKYIKNNFIYKKPVDLKDSIVKNFKKVKKAFITKKSYYFAHPAKYYLKIVGKGVKRGIAAIVTVVVGYVLLKYGPATYRFISNWIEARNLPASYIMAEYNPQSIDYGGYSVINPAQDIKNVDRNVNNIDKVNIIEKIDNETKSSFEEFKYNLKDINSIYMNKETSLSPLFLDYSENENLINLYCKNDDNSATKISFDVYDQELFDNIFKSKNLTCDVINSLKNLLNDENISNIPEILNFVDNKTLSTDVKEEIIGEIVNGEYIENSYYVFLTTEFKNDVVYEKEIKILKSKTSELEDFDNSDLNSLINCYKTNKDKFVSYTYNECQPNVVNIIFKSLNQQNEQEKNLE